jgi:hypothetical protein
MRTLFTFLLAGLISLTAMANTASTNLSIEELTERIWTSEKDQKSVTYYDFQEPSALDIITKKADGSITWNTAFWDLVNEEGNYFLIIKQSLSGEEIRFEVELDEKQLLLFNENLSQVLNREWSNGIDKDVIRTDLLGKWKSPFYDLKNGGMAGEDTKVRHMWKSGFQFNEDGTFVRYLQNGRTAEHESGVWSLSSDGKFIKLHFARNGNVEDIYKRELMNIDDFENNWMRVSTDDLKKDHAMSTFELKKQS